MAQNTNTAIQNPRDSFDQRVSDYFTNYYGAPIKLTAQEFDAAKAFFLNRTSNNEQAAAALTAAVIQASNELGTYILDVLDEFNSASDLKSAVPTFLNMSRISTSLLGYEAQITMTENTKRQVEA